MRARSTFTAVALTFVMIAGSCSSSSPTTTKAAARSVTLVTHDSFAVSKPVLAAFTKSTGWKVRILKNGDAGAALNQVILTKDAPLGDLMFGVDNTFLTRALDQHVFVPFRARAVGRIPPALQLDPSHHVTPIDFGDVCVNADRRWFAGHQLAIPKTLDQLAAPAYRDLLVVENPATSSTGLAFVAATVAHAHGGWLNYWDRLRANGVKVVDGWEAAYNGEFSGAAGSKGARPLVVSYASSPPAEVYFADPQPTTAPTVSLDATCFRQVEFAGVLRGAAHPDGARALINFMLSARFQRDLPLSMFVDPVIPNTPLPEVFTKFATIPSRPFTLTPAEIGRDRSRWISQWTAHVLR